MKFQYFGSKMPLKKLFVRRTLVVVTLRLHDLTVV